MATNKYKRLSRKVLANIRSAFNSASYADRLEGITWYNTANEWCCNLAERLEVSEETACALVAVLSPGCEWERNKASAEGFLQEFQAGKRNGEISSRYSVYGKLALIKAEAICYGQDPLEVLSGPKVCAFYECLVRPTDSRAVVVDRHARVLALGLDRNEANSIVKSLGEYNWIARHYEAIAKELGVLPLQVQGVTWTYHRRTALTARESAATYI